MNKSDFSIRRMEKKDLDQVEYIEGVSFLSPWSRWSFEQELEKECGISLVAAQRTRVLGYLIGWLVADEIHIANLAVHPEWRRYGIGETLVRKIMEDQETIRWIGLEVRSSNRAARTLYQKLGFQEAGVRKNYYIDEKEDAILMVKRLNSVA